MMTCVPFGPQPNARGHENRVTREAIIARALLLGVVLHWHPLSARLIFGRCRATGDLRRALGALPGTAAAAHPRALDAVASDGLLLVALQRDGEPRLLE